MYRNATAQAAIDDALESVKVTHCDWYAAFEDSRMPTQSPIGVDELIEGAPTEFLAGVVAGAVYLKR